MVVVTAVGVVGVVEVVTDVEDVTVRKGVGVVQIPGPSEDRSVAQAIVNYAGVCARG
jgi:hypothetical protein